MPVTVPLENREAISSVLRVPVISADTPQTAENPRINAMAEVTLCSHSLAISSCSSTLTAMNTMASCCSREAGTSISQLTA